MAASSANEWVARVRLSSGSADKQPSAFMTVCSFSVRILCMGFGAGFGTKWKASGSGKQNSAINRHAIHGGGNLFDFGGEALVVRVNRSARLFAQAGGMNF
ncbi:hypothetical protein GCM10028785_27260 [Hydrogenophaga soli]